MKKNLIYLITVLLGICILYGCSDDDGGSDIYITQAGNPVNVKFVMKNDPYIQTFTVSMVSPYPIPSSSGINHDVKVSLETDPSKVEVYNSKEGTSYKIMPEGSYSFPSEVIINAGSYVSENISLSINAKGKIEALETYILPISIKAVEGANTDNSHQTIYFLLTGSIDASDMVFLSRTGWQVIDVSSEELNGEGANNGAAKYAFDGDGQTFWHTQWQGGEPMPPHHITVDMGKEVELQGFSYLTRDFGGAWPKECTIEVSKDNAGWEVAANFTGLPASGATEFRSFFPDAVEARYFKMTITAGYGGASTHVAEINVF
ncbi:MAG: DUF1735 domain-containing protein [Prevotella sp.]|jgi:hypothetical protein|nr:DUF1735 domain-containing protein [Prevotella sp.]